MEGEEEMEGARAHAAWRWWLIAVWDEGPYFKVEGELGKKTHTTDFWSSAGHLPPSDFKFPETFTDPSKMYSLWLNTEQFHCREPRDQHHHTQCYICFQVKFQRNRNPALSQ